MPLNHQKLHFIKSLISAFLFLAVVLTWVFFVFQLVIPIEQFQTSHVRILFKHRSANEGNAELIIINLGVGAVKCVACPQTLCKMAAIILAVFCSSFLKR